MHLIFQTLSAMEVAAYAREMTLPIQTDLLKRQENQDPKSEWRYMRRQGPNANRVAPPAASLFRAEGACPEPAAPAAPPPEPAAPPKRKTRTDKGNKRGYIVKGDMEKYYQEESGGDAPAGYDNFIIV